MHTARRFGGDVLHCDTLCLAAVMHSAFVCAGLGSSVLSTGDFIDPVTSYVAVFPPDAFADAVASNPMAIKVNTVKVRRCSLDMSSLLTCSCHRNAFRTVRRVKELVKAGIHG